MRGPGEESPRLESRGLECALAIVGGNWNNRSNAGLWNWNLNNASSNANVHIGRQTLISRYRSNTALHSPWRLPKIRRKEQGLVGRSPSRNTLRLIRRQSS